MSIREAMPVNFIEIRAQINELGKNIKAFDQKRQQVNQTAGQLLEQYAGRPADLTALVNKVLEKNSRLRCARPLEEALTFAGYPAEQNQAVVVLAADGSQIQPSRHESVQFGLINTGAFRMVPGSGQAPQEFTRSRLLYEEDLYTSQGMVTEEDIALRRDLYERQMLGELAAKESLPVVALTDGPLELFHDPNERPEFRQAFKQYLEAVENLGALKVIHGGYVDKPESDLVVRLLELTLLKEEEYYRAGERSHRALFGISDRLLFSEYLQPGQRSAIFAIQSTSISRYPEELAPCFFYLNAGRDLARVEIPVWLSADTPRLNLLHSVLLQQCQMSGKDPYPYGLHRAHEIAVVGFQEKERLEELILIEFRNQGLEPGKKSFKQSGKNAMGSKTRYR